MSISSNSTAQAVYCIVEWLLPSTIRYPQHQGVPTAEEALQALQQLAREANKKMGCGPGAESVRQAWAIEGERIAAITDFNRRAQEAQKS